MRSDTIIRKKSFSTLEAERGTKRKANAVCVPKN